MRKKNWLAASMLCASLNLFPAGAQEGYVPSDSNLKARQEFADSKFGIFLHWGIYSMFAQGEWYLNNGNLNREEYAKAASGFYPAQLGGQVHLFHDTPSRRFFDVRHGIFRL